MKVYTKVTVTCHFAYKILVTLLLPHIDLWRVTEQQQQQQQQQIHRML